MLGNLLAERRALDPAELHAALAGRILLQPVTQLEISSTELRALLAAGHDARYLCPDAVCEQIRRQACYLDVPRPKR